MLTAAGLTKLIREYDGKPKAVSDKFGLVILFQGKASFTYGFRYQLNGKRKILGMGPVAAMTLAEARGIAYEKWTLLKKGIDPTVQKRVVPTFRIAAEKFIAQRTPMWKNPKSAGQWRSGLESYVYPKIGDLTVDVIDVHHILGCLEPIWTKIPDSAAKIRNRIELILNSSIALGDRTAANPARYKGFLDSLLSPRSKLSRGHMSSLPYADVPDFFERIMTERSSPSAQALAMTILSACRTSEILNLTWDEVHLDEKLLVISAHRMKGAEEHRVPITKTMEDILLNSTTRVGYVFPGARDKRPLSNMAMVMVMRKLGSDLTVHGFRTTFRSWTAEKTNHQNHIAEMALAHKTKGIEGVYQRGDLLEKRRALMADWEKYLTKKKLNTN
jgi:integrase